MDRQTATVFAVIVTLLFCFSPVAFAKDQKADQPYQEFGQDFEETVGKIKDASDKLKELVDKYAEMKLDVIKAEDIAVVDQDGNPQVCNLEVYYDSDYVIELKTGYNGRFAGNFNHGNRFPGKVVSYRLSGCRCRVVSLTHKVSFPGFDEHINRLKSIISDEISDYAGDKAKEAAKKAVESGFDAAGAGELAGPFLAGFGVGADLGAPFGEALTKGLNDMLELSLNQNKQKREVLEGDELALEPANYRRITARLWDFGRTDPMIKNVWNFQVRCDKRFSASVADVPWTDPRSKMSKEQVSVGVPAGQEAGRTGGPNADDRARQEQERREREESERQERRERQERERMEAQYRRQAEEARRAREEALKKAEEEIRKTCPLCDPISRQIADIGSQISAKEAEISDLESRSSQAQSAADKAKKALDDAKARLGEFDNPQSWAESDGRRITSSDLQIDRMIARANWERYRSGEQTAQETSDNWKNYNDDDRAKAKEEYRKGLQDAIDRAKEASEKADKEAASMKSQLSQAKQSLAGLQKSLENLNKQLEDCLKLCKKYAAMIARQPEMTYQMLRDYEAEQAPKTQVTPAVKAPSIKAPQPITARPSQQGPCARYALLLSRYGVTPAQYERLTEESLIRLKISEGMKSAIDRERSDCSESSTGVAYQPAAPSAIPMVRSQPVSGQVETATAQKEVSCPEFCQGKGMSHQQKDWSGEILSVLNSQGVCAKSASIDFGSYLRSGSCVCYPSVQPSISISPEKLSCNTQCGAVACGSSAQCSCGENCVLKVECRWGGWKRVSERAYVPTVAASSS